MANFPPVETRFASVKFGVSWLGVFHFASQLGSAVTTNQTPSPFLALRAGVSGTALPSLVRHTSCAIAASEAKNMKAQMNDSERRIMLPNAPVLAHAHRREAPNKCRS